MKTLLGLIGSPRKNGNSELMVKEIHRHLSGGWELKLLRLPEFNIRPCTACYKCLFGEMKCLLKDDFRIALEALLQADAYVVATPTYFLSANASLKRFLDRGLSFKRHLEELWGKPAVGVIVAGYPGLEGYTKLMVESFIALTMAQNHGTEVVYAALPGEVLLQKANKEIAKKLSEALVAEKPERRNPGLSSTCGLCGGDTFRFLDDNRLKCMLCSSEGTYSWSEGHLQIKIDRPEHSLFLSYEAAKDHLVFLQGMKEKFTSQRKKLKILADDYAGDGDWIRPQDTEA